MVTTEKWGLPSLSTPEKRVVPLYITEEERLIVARARSAKTLTWKEFRSAIGHLIESGSLPRIVETESCVAIVADDYARPTPTPAILPIVLSELKRNRVCDDDITISIGGGLPTPASKHQFSAIVSEETARAVKVPAHNCDDDSSLIGSG